MIKLGPKLRKKNLKKPLQIKSEAFIKNQNPINQKVKS